MHDVINETKSVWYVLVEIEIEKNKLIRETTLWLIQKKKKSLNKPLAFLNSGENIYSILKLIEIIARGSTVNSSLI